jgi:hypothetical protein
MFALTSLYTSIPLAGRKANTPAIVRLTWPRKPLKPLISNIILEMQPKLFTCIQTKHRNLSPKADRPVFDRVAIVQSPTCLPPLPPFIQTISSTWL